MTELPTARLDLSRYDRSPALNELERARIAAIGAGESLHLRRDDPLTRLMAPLKACLSLTQAQPCQYSLLRHLVAEMEARQSAFWAWQELEWTSLYQRCKGAMTAANTLQHVMAMAALLCAVDLPELRNQERRIIRRHSLTVKIFGQERVDRSIHMVQAELKRLGYTGYFHSEVRNALCELFLVNQSAELEALTSESLEKLRAQECAHVMKQATFMLSHAFVGLGIMPRPLRPYIAPSYRKRKNETNSISPEWLSWCKRWHETSVLRATTKRSALYRLLVVGRWLKASHPEISRPDQWSRQLAAEYIAAVRLFRVGQFVDDRRTIYPDKPLSASSRLGHISALRCFFCDLLQWELVPYRFDPSQTFRFPRSINLLRSPNPRIIAEDVWAKLLWAGLNLEYSDLPRSKNSRGEAARPRYPITMIRTLVGVWLFAGLRKDEIARLRVGCVRWQSPGDANRPKDGSSVCLLDVPANKTSGNYTKPVHGVAGKAIEEWQRLRPAMRPVVDDKSGEMFHVLFGYRGRPVGSIVLNRSVIPMLCRKAGVPGFDLRGQITSHLARSTIATQLYNAKQPTSLLALKEWLGHRRLASTQWYAAITPDRLTQAYVDARYFGRNVAVVQVLLDRTAIESGAAGRGEAYKYVHLGHGYCANPYWAQCQHRMACQRCDFTCRGTQPELRLQIGEGRNRAILGMLCDFRKHRMAGRWELNDDQWAVVELVLKPEKRADNRGRPWHETRALLNGVLWILGTGAQRRELPRKYPPYQTCHRRFQQWVRSGKLEEALKLLARHLYKRGQLKLEEAFVDATFASAKKGASPSAPPVAARAPRSSLSPLVTVFLSPYLSRALRQPSASLWRRFWPAGSSDKLPARLIGDKAYDSDPLDTKLAEEYGIELIAPNRRLRRKTPNRRRLRCYRRRWKVERLFAWMHNFRRLVTRWEYHIENFLGFVHLACLHMLLRHILIDYLLLRFTTM